MTRLAFSVLVFVLVLPGCCSRYVAEREAYDAAVARRLEGLADRAIARTADIGEFVELAQEEEAHPVAIRKAAAALMRELEADAAEARKLAEEAARDAD